MQELSFAEIMSYATIAEDNAIAFYKGAAAKASQASVKKFLEELAAMEMGHKRHVEELIKMLEKRPPPRVPGTAVFLTAAPESAPTARKWLGRYLAQGEAGLRGGPTGDLYIFIEVKDLDQAIMKWLADEFKKQSGIDVMADPLTRQRLDENAEKAKIAGEAKITGKGNVQDKVNDYIDRHRTPNCLKTGSSD